MYDVVFEACTFLRGKSIRTFGIVAVWLAMAMARDDMNDGGSGVAKRLPPWHVNMTCGDREQPPPPAAEEVDLVVPVQKFQ